MTNPPTGPDADAWQILSPLLLRGGYLPWTTGSMRPAGLVEVCNEIVHGDRTRTLECGSGVSTVLLARLLHERERGALTSLEHDRHWAILIEDQRDSQLLSNDRGRPRPRQACEDLAAAHRPSPLGPTADPPGGEDLVASNAAARHGTASLILEHRGWCDLGGGGDCVVVGMTAITSQRCSEY